MERYFQLNWTAYIEEAVLRRKRLKLTQRRLALLAKVSTPTISRFENGEKDIQLSSILSILGVLGMVDQRHLEFPQPNSYNDFDRMVIVFWGQAGDKRIKCAISKEALDDHYRGNSRLSELQIFINNQRAIEHEARRKYLENRLEPDGTILIKSADIDY